MSGLYRPYPGPYIGLGRHGNRRVYSTMLVVQLIQRIREMEYVPPVTLYTLVLLAGIFGLKEISARLPRYMRPYFGKAVSYFSTSNTCLQPRRVLAGQLRRLWASSLVHVDEVHLLYNCFSFLYKGAMLEPIMGSASFLSLLMYLSVLAHLIYVFCAVAAERLKLPIKFMDSCVVGFSGVIFGLKVILNSYPHLTPGSSNFFGIRIPRRATHWSELILAKILIPNSSFLGHLSGILAGFVYLMMSKLPAQRSWGPGRRMHGD